MGSNDIANATGSLVGTGTFSPLTAGLLGGLGLAVGMLTWGSPLLQKVAFDIVTVDRPMATAAQLVQAAVVLAAVAFGFFTSMNQALSHRPRGRHRPRLRHRLARQHHRWYPCPPRRRLAVVPSDVVDRSGEPSRMVWDCLTVSTRRGLSWHMLGRV